MKAQIKTTKRIEAICRALFFLLLGLALLESLLNPSGTLTPWFVALSLLPGAIYFILRYSRYEAAIAEQQSRIEELEKRSIQQPAKASYAWDLARVKLEAYFDRNLMQVKSIFWVAVGVMVVGFAFILWALRFAVLSPEHITVALIGTAAGVIAQFIGVTCMVIYRSTMLQAAKYMSILERINTVGMAVQILDTVDGKMDNPMLMLKDTTRVDIIKILLAQSAAVSVAQATPPERNPDEKASAASS